jgi:hypothetical protein
VPREPKTKSVFDCRQLGSDEAPHRATRACDGVEGLARRGADSAADGAEHAVAFVEPRNAFQCSAGDRALGYRTVSCVPPRNF